MPTMFGVNVTGAQKVFIRARLLDKAVQVSVKRELFRSALKVVGRAKQIIQEKGHIVTGNLQRSIAAEVGDQVNIGLFEVNVGTNVIYGPKIEALPDGGFLLPAFQEKGPEVINDMRRLISQALDQFDKGK